MVNIHELPEQFKVVAERIPAEILKQLTAVEAVARCIEARKWYGVVQTNPDPRSARGAAQLAYRILIAPAGETADGLMALAAATSDAVLRSGYYAKAEQRRQEEPSHTSFAEAREAIAEARARQDRKRGIAAQPRRWRKPRAQPSDKSVTAERIRRAVADGVAAARARIDDRAAGLEREIAATRGKIAADAGQASSQVLTKDTPTTMLFKSRTSNPEAERYRRMANQVTDLQARLGYMQLAERAERGDR